jgi:hypothetical protein
MSHDTTKISQKVTMLGAALSLLVPVAIGGCGSDNKTPTTPSIDVKIGAMLPRTGPNANSDWVSAVELAVADMTVAMSKAKMIAQPLTFTLDEQDTASDETKSHDAMMTYSNEGARAVITEASNAAIGGNKWNYEQLLADAQSPLPMALISFTATSAALHAASTDPIPARAAGLTDVSHWFYRTCPVSNNLSTIRLNQIFTGYGDINGDGKVKVVWIGTTDTSTQSSITGDIKAVNTYLTTADGIAALNGKVFISENVSFDAGTDPASFDYTAAIAKATDAHNETTGMDDFVPDLIINKALPTIAIPFIKAYKQNSANTYAIFQDGSFRRNSLLLALGAAADGQVGVSNIAFMNNLSGTTFKTEQQAQTHFPPAAYEAQGYDAMAIALLAVFKASVTNPNMPNDPTTMTNDSVRAAVNQLNDPNAEVPFGTGPAEFQKALEAIQLGKTVNYNGASGNIDFDANGDTYDYATLWKIEGGQFVEKEFFNCLPMQNCAGLSMLPDH